MFTSVPVSYLHQSSSTKHFPTMQACKMRVLWQKYKHLLWKGSNWIPYCLSNGASIQFLQHLIHIIFVGELFLINIHFCVCVWWYETVRTTKRKFYNALRLIKINSYVIKQLKICIHFVVVFSIKKIFFSRVHYDILIYEYTIQHFYRSWRYFWDSIFKRCYRKSHQIWKHEPQLEHITKLSIYYSLCWSYGHITRPFA